MTQFSRFLAGCSLLSLFIFPWPLAAFLALLAAPALPLAPLALGLIADALYLPNVHILPLATMLGAAFTLAAYLVHRRLSPGIIGA